MPNTRTVTLEEHIEHTLERVQKARMAVNLNKPNGEELWMELGTAEAALLHALNCFLDLD